LTTHLTAADLGKVVRGMRAATMKMRGDRCRAAGLCVLCEYHSQPFLYSEAKPAEGPRQSMLYHRDGKAWAPCARTANRELRREWPHGLPPWQAMA